MKRAILASLLLWVSSSAALAANYPTPPLPYQVLDTTHIVAVKIGEGVTTTAPTYSIVYSDSTETSTNPGAAYGSFTTSYASACAAPAQNVRNVSTITVCNIDTVTHTIYVNVAPSGTPATITAGLVSAYSLSAGFTLTMTSSSITVSSPLTLPLSVPNGGTGQVTLTSGAFVVGNGTSAVSLVGPGSAGQIPISSGTAPVMQTVSGDITITSSGVTAIGALKVTNGMLAGSIAASKLVGSDIATVGTITSGTWNGSAVQPGFGGTGITSYAIGDILSPSGATTFTKIADVAAGAYFRSGGVTTLPLWSTLLLPNSATTGDLFYASATNTMSNLLDVATGSALISGGVGVAPSWGKIGLQTHISGTLLPTNGGTGLSSYVAGDMLYASGVGTLTVRAIGTNGNRLQTVSGVPNWGKTINRTTQSSTPYTVVAADDGSVIDITTGAGNFVLNLTASATLGAGHTVWIRKIDSGAGLVNITPAAGDGINGATAAAVYSLTKQYACVGLMATGANTTDAWQVISCAGDFITSTLNGVTPNLTNQYKNITSITLTPGEWDISGHTQMTCAGITATTSNQMGGGISTDSVDTTFSDIVVGDNSGFVGLSGGNVSFTTTYEPRRFSVTTSTTYYLKGYATFTTVGTSTFSGRIMARRIR